MSAAWGLRLSTPETARSAAGPSRLSRPPLVSCTPTTRCPTSVCARVGEKLAEAACEDSGAARTTEDGVSALNGSLSFAELSAGEQLDAEGIKGSDFPSAAAGLAALW